MIELLWGTFVFILRAIYVVLEIVVFVSDIRQLWRWMTGNSSTVEVPPEPKIISPAAQRALDEAKQRRNHAASGTVQAS
ncbi:hypothetical protein LJR220_001781 [Bradyrhizobium sp. LjRoot220]|uniref:hypothetical protein n=1 Tax=Bradyrhizobium sp. LjRoot220 TaxID=3342284 RepID=UPI003ECCAA4F